MQFLLSRLTLRIKIIALFLMLCTVAKNLDGKKSCRDKLQNTVIPRYANSVQETTTFKITYPGGNEVKCGNYLSALVTLTAPTLRFDVHDKCINTTVLFIGIPYNFYDTDYILGFPYLHWLVHNVPASVLKEDFRGQAGDVKTDYLFPVNPFSDHMYTFFIYCQDEYIEVNEKIGGLLFGRPSFNPKNYSEEFGLGEPLAINYFISSLVNDAPIPPSLNKVE